MVLSSYHVGLPTRTPWCQSLDNLEGFAKFGYLTGGTVGTYNEDAYILVPVFGSPI